MEAIASRDIIDDTSVVRISFRKGTDGIYELGVGGPQEGSAADALLKESGRAKDLPQDGYVKALLSSRSDIMDLLRESVRRLAINIGEAPRVGPLYPRDRHVPRTRGDEPDFPLVPAREAKRQPAPVDCHY